jgi:transcriptional antiterminator RfaH
MAELQAHSANTDVQLRHFSPGEAVTVTDGPFVGLEAIYQMTDGEGRVMVLLNILSKPVQLSIEPTSIKNLS